MARRIDYYDDPAAPKPNSVVPAAVAVVAREDGAVLMIRRTDNGYWALPGGAIEMNESVAEAAVRETFEETGIQVEVTGLVDRDAAPLAAVTSIPSSRSRMITAAQGVGRETFGLMARVWHVSSRADAGLRDHAGRVMGRCLRTAKPRVVRASRG